MAVAVRAGEGFETETPKELFEIRLRNDPSRLYDVSPDGQRILTVAPAGNENVPPITLVQNWPALLRRQK